MKKRAVIVAFIAACLALVLAVVVWKIAAGPRSPVYQGHSVEYWLGEVFTTNQVQAMRVLRDAGPEAAPALIRAFEITDSSRRKFYATLYSKLPGSWQKHLTRPVPATEIWSATELVFLNNKSAARAAVPGLLGLLGNKNDRLHPYIVASVAHVIGPQDHEWVPVLIQCLQDTNVYMRVCAAETLWKIDRQTNVVVASLKAALSDTASTNEVMLHAKYRAAVLLSEVDCADLSALPVLIAALQGSNGNLAVFQTGAAVTVGRYGPAGGAATPALIKAVETGDPDLRASALRSLKIIDPEAAAKYESR